MTWLKKLTCKIIGHDYPCTIIDDYTLCYCRRCEKEIIDRTLDDILERPDDENYYNYDFDD